MAVRLGLHADRLASVRTFRTSKAAARNRASPSRARRCSARRADHFPVEELYATQEAYDASPLARQLDAGGSPFFILGPASAGHVSDLATPSGIVAVSPVRLCPAAPAVRRRRRRSWSWPTSTIRPTPARCSGRRTRSAARGSFSGLGVDPFHPKVVRGSMGAVFRLAIAVADPEEVAQAAAGARWAAGPGRRGRRLEKRALGAARGGRGRQRAPRTGPLGGALPAPGGDPDAWAERESQRGRGRLDRPVRSEPPVCRRRKERGFFRGVRALPLVK